MNDCFSIPKMQKHSAIKQEGFSCILTRTFLFKMLFLIKKQCVIYKSNAFELFVVL